MRLKKLSSSAVRDLMANFEQILDLLQRGADEVFATHGVSFDTSTKLDAERTDVIVASIGFGGRDLRGALTLSAPGNVWEAMAPDVLGTRPIDRALLADFAGEMANMIIGRFRNSLLRCNVRSEEHTSELQSQSNLVCRLLLEKKKMNYSTIPK